MKLTNTTVKFNLNKKPIEFNIIHNLPEIKGLNIKGAIRNWLARTKIFTVESLCEYIKSKGNSFIALAGRNIN